MLPCFIVWARYHKYTILESFILKALRKFLFLNLDPILRPFAPTLTRQGTGNRTPALLLGFNAEGLKSNTDMAETT